MPLDLVQGAPILTAMANNLGPSLVGNLAFRWLRDRGGLLLPILVHGLLGFLGSGR